MKCASVSATLKQSAPTMPKLRIFRFSGVDLQMIARLQDELLVANERLDRLHAHIRGSLWIPLVCALLRSLEGAVAVQPKSLPGSDFAATSPGAGRLALGR